MKLKYAFLLVALLSLGACSNPSTETSESESISESEHEPTVIEKYKVKTLQSHIADSNFKNGFEQMSQYTTDAHVEGVLDYGGNRETDHYNPESENKTYWQHCQWWSPFNFMNATYSKVGDTHRYQNESRLMEVNPEKGTLKMALNSGAEYDYLYGGKLPADKSWAHFLIQQSFPPELYIPVHEYDEIRVKLDITIDKADYVGKEAKKYDSECAQLLFYFSIAERDPETGKAGNTMWFGVPIFDSRYNYVPEHHAMDTGFTGATGKLIHSISSKEYMGTGPVQMGKKYSIDLNVREHIQDAFVRAISENIFKDANWKNFTIYYMNFGWELPGEYDVSATISYLDVVTVKY